MVRLKAGGVHLVFKFAIISIPYGAIKSAKIEGKYGTFDKFQFLMVRLKGKQIY